VKNRFQSLPFKRNLRRYATANRLLMQTQADVLGLCVSRPGWGAAR
jgi:hypothetical protein